MSTLFGSIRVSASGMAVGRTQMDVISVNLANANAMRVGGQAPYARRVVLVQGSPDGPRVVRVAEDPSPPRTSYDPQNPYADETGHVTYTNVEPIKEMVDMIAVSRAYEANVAAFNATKGMIRSALAILRA